MKKNASILNPQVFLPLLLLGFFGCSSTEKNWVPSEVSRDDLRESSVEVRYTLAQNNYRLQVAAVNGEVNGYNGVNEQPIERQKIRSVSYLNFLKKASSILDSLKKKMKNEEIKDCKTPFLLTVQRSGEPLEKIAGCRSHDSEGQVGRLIQEGEFLFYSPPTN
ncbi:MAG: hypothetical protein H7301_02820 [Cryobacterium sp.]|nr:hypothetical protein [Oligoflexia bacterium]